MLEICKFFTVQRDVLGDTEDYFSVEDCSSFDPALSGFALVCPMDNVEDLLRWVEDNSMSLDGYVRESFNQGKYSFALDLVRDTLGISNFTGEFVAEHGSIQGFLDVYGNPYSDTSPLNPEVGDYQGDSFDAPFLSSSWANEEPKDIAEDFSSEVLDRMADSYQENTPDNFHDDFPDDGTSQETSGSSSEEFPDESLNDSGTVIEFPRNNVVSLSKDPVDESDSGMGLANVTEQEIDLLTQPAPPEDESISMPSQTDAMGTPVEFAVEYNDKELPGVTMRDGKAIIEFSSLANLITEVIGAVQQLESAGMDKLKILTKEQLPLAAAEVDRYAPSVIKDFLIYYTMNAETDTDLVRVTSLLDEFSTYVNDKKIKRY